MPTWAGAAEAREGRAARCPARVWAERQGPARAGRPGGRTLPAGLACCPRRRQGGKAWPRAGGGAAPAGGVHDRLRARARGEAHLDPRCRQFGVLVQQEADVLPHCERVKQRAALQRGWGGAGRGAGVGGATWAAPQRLTCNHLRERGGAPGRWSSPPETPTLLPLPSKPAHLEHPPCSRDPASPPTWNTSPTFSLSLVSSSLMRPRRASPLISTSPCRQAHMQTATGVGRHKGKTWCRTSPCGQASSRAGSSHLPGKCVGRHNKQTWKRTNKGTRAGRRYRTYSRSRYSMFGAK